MAPPISWKNEYNIGIVLWDLDDPSLETRGGRNRYKRPGDPVVVVSGGMCCHEEIYIKVRHDFRKSRKILVKNYFVRMEL